MIGSFLFDTMTGTRWPYFKSKLDACFIEEQTESLNKICSSFDSFDLNIYLDYHKTYDNIYDTNNAIIPPRDNFLTVFRSHVPPFQ